jgi:hypothetical protein
MQAACPSSLPRPLLLDDAYRQGAAGMQERRFQNHGPLRHREFEVATHGHGWQRQPRGGRADRFHASPGHVGQLTGSVANVLRGKIAWLQADKIRACPPRQLKIDVKSHRSLPVPHNLYRRDNVATALVERNQCRAGAQLQARHRAEDLVHHRHQVGLADFRHHAITGPLTDNRHSCPTAPRQSRG